MGWCLPASILSGYGGSALRVGGGKMRRRNFLALMGGSVVASPWSALAQQPRLIKIGLLYPGPLAAAKLRAETLRETFLRPNGWPDDTADIVICFADGDLARARAGKRTRRSETRRAAACELPWGRRFSEGHEGHSDRRLRPRDRSDRQRHRLGPGPPGRQHDRVFFDFPDFSTKWMELLKETIPHLSKVAVVVHPESPSPQLKGVENPRPNYSR